MRIFAIDPGNEESAYAVMDGYALLETAKKPNEEVRADLTGWFLSGIETVVIERVQCMGMPAGRTLFETCEQVGRFTEIAERENIPFAYIYRNEEKLALCGDSRAKDTNIRAALIARFAKHDLKRGTGTIKNPDVFYGVSKDMWSAIAVGVTYLDKVAEGKADGCREEN
jgi:hypothetical protein